MNNVKNNIKKGFTIIPNGLILDSSLSDRARFVFCYMASKPDDWSFYQKPMAKELGYSVDTLRKYIDELLGSGWLSREVQRGEKGKFDTYDYTMNTVPNFTVSEKTRHGKNPTRKKPDTEKVGTTNKDYKLKNTLTNTDTNKAFSENEFSGANFESIEIVETEYYPLNEKQNSPPVLRATPPPAGQPNQVYGLYEKWAAFIESKGVKVARTKSGNYLFSAKDGAAIKRWITWAEGMGVDDIEAGWEAFLSGAWNGGSKWLKENFSVAILDSQKVNISIANRDSRAEIQDSIAEVLSGKYDHLM